MREMLTWLSEYKARAFCLPAAAIRSDMGKQPPINPIFAEQEYRNAAESGNVERLTQVRTMFKDSADPDTAGLIKSLDKEYGVETDQPLMKRDFGGRA